MSSQRKNPTARLLLLFWCFLIVCVILLFVLALQMVTEENRRIIGEADQRLSAMQHYTYGLTLFFEQKKLLSRNEQLLGTILEINDGTSLDDLINDLELNGLKNDPTLLRKALIYTGADRRLMPGKYQISPGSSLVDIAAILQDPSASMVDFVVLPGWRKEEIAMALPSSGLEVSMEDFLQISNLPVTDINLSNLGVRTYEGFFAPGRYTFHRNIVVNDFIYALVEKTITRLDEEVINGINEQGLDINEAIILASIIQREAVLEEEKPLIASVFINRLNAGIPLQSDPTVQYALGFNPEWGWWKSPLNLSDLEIESTYNTYIIPGLPPAPISNPDLSSIRAVAFPAESEYFYFRALCDGSNSHVFSVTLEEHINNACPEIQF